MENIHLLKILVSILLNDICMFFFPKIRETHSEHVGEYSLISDKYMPNEQTQWNPEEVRKSYNLAKLVGI